MLVRKENKIVKTEDRNEDLRKLKSIINFANKKVTRNNRFYFTDVSDVDFSGRIHEAEDLLIKFDWTILVSMETGQPILTNDNIKTMNLSDDFRISVDLSPREGLNVSFFVKDYSGSSTTNKWDRIPKTYNDLYKTKFPEQTISSYLRSDEIKEDILNCMEGIIDFCKKNNWFV